MAWVEFSLIQRPYYNPSTNEEILSIDDLNNFGEKKFSGGGYVYPDLSDYNVLFLRDMNGKLIAQIDSTASDINALISKLMI